MALEGGLRGGGGGGGEAGAGGWGGGAESRAMGRARGTSGCWWPDDYRRAGSRRQRQ